MKLKIFDSLKPKKLFTAKAPKTSEYIGFTVSLDDSVMLDGKLTFIPGEKVTIWKIEGNKSNPLKWQINNNYTMSVLRFYKQWGKVKDKDISEMDIYTFDHHTELDAEKLPTEGSKEDQGDGPQVLLPNH